MYKTGVVYIWQNRVGKFAYLNGSETMVTRPSDKNSDIWVTDTISPFQYSSPGSSLLYVTAWPGHLREKYPPSGELKVLEWFKQPELELA